MLMNQEKEPLLAFPLTLPMGWNKSPPYFCAFTKTAADICNQQINLPEPDPPYICLQYFEHLIKQQVAPVEFKAHLAPQIKPIPQHLLLARALAYLEIDFIGMVQTKTLAAKVQRITLNVISSIFRSNDTTDNNHKERISESKVCKGDVTWATSKIILGWLVDTVHQNIQLPTHRVE